MTYKSNQKGFSLIEVLVSLAILGVLTAVAIPAYNGYITTAKMAEAENNLAAIRLAEEEFFLENNRYFDGADVAEIQSNSGNLWTVTKGKDGYNFDYEVTLSGGWSAKATGKVGTKVAGLIRNASKN